MSSWAATNADPLDALCRHFNVVNAKYVQGPLEERFEMTLTTLNGSLYPTHCLAVTQTNAPPGSPILIIPVDSGLFSRVFNQYINWPKEDDLPPEIPLEPEVPDETPVTIPQLPEGPVKISLPVVPLVVPHLTSFSLLTLFGLGIETDVEKLPYRLLPTPVVAEFPAPAAMAEIFARFPEQQFEGYHMYIHGIWKNILSLGLKDNRIVEIVSTAWSVASEARRIRQRATQRR